jgi:hypothetical protein
MTAQEAAQLKKGNVVFAVRDAMGCSLEPPLRGEIIAYHEETGEVSVIHEYDGGGADYWPIEAIQKEEPK